MSKGTDEKKTGDVVPLNFTESEAVKYVEKQVKIITKKSTFDNAEVQQALKNIGQMYFKYKGLRCKLADVLIQEKFSDHTLKMLNFFNNVGVFRNDETWFPCYYTMNLLWNYSDASQELCKDLAEVGVLALIVKNLGHQPYKENASSKNVYYILKSSLSICQNIASKAPESKTEFSKANAVEVIKEYLEWDDDFLKALSVLCLSALVDESENAVLETGAIPFICGSMKKALESNNRRHRGFTPTELCQGLGRMAVNDNNKKKARFIQTLCWLPTVEAGALPLFVQMMQHTEEEEQEAAAKAVWILAFDKEVQENIKNEAGMVDALRKLTDSTNSRVKKASKGALWKLEGEQKHQEKQKDGSRPPSGKANVQHVFISYNWTHQSTIVQLANKLKEDGFRVWIDVDQMEGSTLEAMASAVENAAVVLIGVSEKYKKSPNCRTEAEYTFQLRKPIVPIMMQRRYRADGWLGMLLGSKLYINFDGKYAFEHAYTLLLKELKERGRGHGTTAENDAEAGAVTSVPRSKESNHSKVEKWECKDVKNWLTENQLKNVSNSLNNYDGRKLVRLQKMRHEAPEFFYRCLEEKLKLKMEDILDFTGAMDTLLT